MFERYAVFYTPAGALAEFGAAWLGWDSAAGNWTAHEKLGDVDVAKITATPRKYGLHGTLKAPFRLASEATQATLETAMKSFAARTASCEIGPLALRHQNGFVALRPEQNSVNLQEIAATIVRSFDMFRAPLTPAEIERRRRARLSPRQDAQLLEWGYPFVLDDFHFHLTLSGALPASAAEPVMSALAARLMPLVANPFILDAVTLMGEDREGMFHQIHRYALTG